MTLINRRFIMKFIKYQKISSNMILFILFNLMLLDYILTYYGMYSLGILEETNYLMLWLMKLPFSKGLIIRTLHSIFLILLFKYIEQHKKSSTFKKILMIPLIIQLIPLSHHILWIYNYANFLY